MDVNTRSCMLCEHLAAVLGNSDNSCGRLRVVRAAAWHQRMHGLLGRRRLHHRSGLWLTPCNIVHTVGMRFSLTVVFLDCSDRCLKVVWCLPPNRVAACFSAKSVVEFACRNCYAAGGGNSDSPDAGA